MPTIYIVTPTKRPEQIPDLTRLAQTLMHVPSIMWLVIEDAEILNPQVSDILRRSGIRFVHMIGKPLNFLMNKISSNTFQQPTTSFFVHLESYFVFLINNPTFCLLLLVLEQGSIYY